MRHPLKSSLAYLAILSLSISCVRTEEIENAPKFEHEFSVQAELPEIEQDPDTKAYLGSYIGATWTEGDKVSVVNLTTGKILGGSLSSNSGGTRTTLSGTVSGTIAKNDKLALFYPSFGVSQETEFGPSQNFNLASQERESGVPLVAYSIFTSQNSTGKISGLNLSFYYAMSFLKINMANLPANGNISQLKIQNIPVEFSMSIKGSKDEFEIATDAEKTALGVIQINGDYKTSPSGTLAIAIGVMPSDYSSDRRVIVSVESYGDYISPLAAAKLNSHEYYNTIASKFEKFQLAGKSGYGIYDISTGMTLHEYEELGDNVVVGTENGENDFSLVNTSSNQYWTIKGIPEDAKLGSTFESRHYSYGIEGYPEKSTDNATVLYTEDEGEFLKMWVKAGDCVYIIRKNKAL